MKAIATLMALAALLALAACDQPRPTCYPISGQPCSPDDPVHGLRAGWVPLI
jgi:predicted small lipoprotein YifL